MASITINIHCVGGGENVPASIPMTIKPTDDIEMVRALVADLFGWDPTSTLLLLNGHRLQGGTTAELGLENNATVYAVNTPPSASIEPPPPAFAQAPTASSSSSSPEAEGCPICLSTFDQDATVYTTECGHMFCAECITRHLQAYSTCPLCRGALKVIHLRKQNDSTAVCCIKLKYERQVYEVALSRDVKLPALYKIVADMFYLSAKHVKLIHKGEILTKDTYTPAMLRGPDSDGTIKYPVFQLIGRTRGGKVWKDEQARNKDSCALS